MEEAGLSVVAPQSQLALSGRRFSTRHDPMSAVFPGPMAIHVLKAASTGVEQCSGDLIDEIDKDLFLERL